MPIEMFNFLTLALVPDGWTSAVILSSSTAIFVVSWAVFHVLVSRSTEQRHRVAMSDWGRERGFRFREIPASKLPAPLNSIAQSQLRILMCMSSKSVSLLNVESSAPPEASVAPPSSATWNFLIREIPTTWPATGLRPATATSSALDLFSLTSFPLLGASDRFVLYGTDSSAAASLSRSSARGLLPADVGLLLQGNKLLLDFSQRPFDTIEFERMMVVADQIAGHLPAPDAAK